MATMCLKDTCTCECGKIMFPFTMDMENKTIEYKCSCCGETVTKAFDEVKSAEGERFDYFCLNDDGDITWKCGTHGYCDFSVEWLNDDWQDKVDRFVELGCCLEKYPEEFDDMFEDFGGNQDELFELFSHLEPEQIEEIANEMGIMVEDDIYQAFMNEYQERLCDCCLDDFDTFKEEIISTMFDLGLCAE